MNGESGLVLAALRRCRSRLRAVLFWRYGCAAMAVAALSLEILAFVLWPAVGRLFAVGATLAIGTLAAAALCAFIRTPTLRHTAALVDRRLHLSDRLVTAIQFLEHSDPMSRLVVRDAALQVADVRLSQAFPLEAPTYGRLAFAALIVGPLVVSLATTVVPGLWHLSRADGHEDAGSRGPSIAASTRVLSSRPPTDTATAPTAATPARLESAARLAVPTGSVIPPPAPTDLSQSTTESERPGQEKSGSAGRTAPADVDTQAAADVGLGASRSASRSSESLTGAGGGVRWDPLAAAPQLAGSPPNGPAYTAAYRAAWSRAQAAIAQERIPAHLRTYVKNYFVAVRPPEPE